MPGCWCGRRRGCVGRERPGPAEDVAGVTSTTTDYHRPRGRHARAASTLAPLDLQGQVRRLGENGLGLLDSHLADLELLRKVFAAVPRQFACMAHTPNGSNGPLRRRQIATVYVERDHQRQRPEG